MLPFECIIKGTPKSLQAKGKGKWQEQVRQSVAGLWGNRPTAPGELAVSITYLIGRTGRGGQKPDVDNVPKPILDAMNKLVYPDDTMVTDLLCRKRYLDGGLNILNPSPDLLNYFRQNAEAVLIAVDNAPIQEVHL